MVDDDPIVRADVHLVLEDAGFDMCPGARDGEEAVELARAHQPDLILMDLGLPGIDGVEATRRILGERDVPIVALSGRASGVVERALAAGAVAHVAKPFEQAQLVRTVRSALAERPSGADRYGELPSRLRFGQPGWKRLGEHMAELGVLGNEELAAALNEQNRTGGRLGDILLSRGLLDPTALTLWCSPSRTISPSSCPRTRRRRCCRGRSPTGNAQRRSSGRWGRRRRLQRSLSPSPISARWPP